MLPSITFRTVENQTFLTHPCQVALVYLNNQYTGIRLHKRLDDGLYFLTKKVNYACGTDAYFYDLVGESLTKEKATLVEMIKNWFSSGMYAAWYK